MKFQEAEMWIDGMPIRGVGKLKATYLQPRQCLVGRAMRLIQAFSESRLSRNQAAFGTSSTYRRSAGSSGDHLCPLCVATTPVERGLPAYDTYGEFQWQFTSNAQIPKHFCTTLTRASRSENRSDGSLPGRRVKTDSTTRTEQLNGHAKPGSSLLCMAITLRSTLSSRATSNSRPVPMPTTMGTSLKPFSPTLIHSSSVQQQVRFRNKATLSNNLRRNRPLGEGTK